MKNVLIIDWLRIFGYLEGVSYLALGVTMYYKYFLDNPTPNYIVGMAHGVLFVGYCFLCLLAGRKYKWDKLTVFAGLFASLIPVGTFIVDYQIFKKESQKIKGK